jgi:hypothetical protein
MIDEFSWFHACLKGFVRFKVFTWRNMKQKAAENAAGMSVTTYRVAELENAMVYRVSHLDTEIMTHAY